MILKIYINIIIKNNWIIKFTTEKKVQRKQYNSLIKKQILLDNWICKDLKLK